MIKIAKISACNPTLTKLCSQESGFVHSIFYQRNLY